MLPHARARAHARTPSSTPTLPVTPIHAHPPTHSLPAKFVPGPQMAAAASPHLGEEGGQADEHGGPMAPQRPHLRRAHPGDPARADPRPCGAVWAMKTRSPSSPRARRGGRRRSAGLGLSGCGASPFLLPPVHGRPGGDTARRPELFPESNARAGNPTSLSPPPEYFYFHPREFVLCLPYETGFFPGGPKGRLRERRDADRLTGGGAAGVRRPGRGRRRREDPRSGGPAPERRAPGRSCPHPARRQASGRAPAPKFGWSSHSPRRPPGRLPARAQARGHLHARRAPPAPRTQGCPRRLGRRGGRARRRTRGPGDLATCAPAALKPRLHPARTRAPRCRVRTRGLP